MCVLALLVSACGGCGGGGDNGSNTGGTIAPSLALFAGSMTGQFGSNVDGTGAAARFHTPDGVATDSAGNVYVVDNITNTIRSITPAGLVTTLAGAVAVNSYVDGIGVAARFSSPRGAAVDSAGNVYVADQGNNCVRKISPAGVVTTLAGSPGQGSADGVGTAARFSSPRDVATDGAGNVYVADQGNATIRKIAPGGVVTTLAGLAGVEGSADGVGSAARFAQPMGISVDGAGNVYVADNNNNTIRKVTPANVVTTFAGTAGAGGYADGVGAAARFDAPRGLAVDAAGNVYVADTGNATIRKITPVGVVTTVVGTVGQLGFASGALPGLLGGPIGVAISGTSLYVTRDRGVAVVLNLPQAEG